ncbi:MAG: hypothetical protein KIT84_35810 [Labilithrix sp.]|nr:hypothetical protein [Labilithrix sp.]MCW5816420.1 hypothetical protein [Labilithrix sp.]
MRWAGWSLVLGAAVTACVAPEVEEPVAEESAAATGELTLLPAARLATIRASLPRVADERLASILESRETIWYDRTAIVPGYQDSFGDNVIAPIGFRPNTIKPGMINLAVPGGHEKLFVTKGTFHFPFGISGAATDPPNMSVVDFWVPPRDSAGKPLPVVYWRRDPNQYTHKYVWSFPKGTVFGEVLYLTASNGAAYVFEIRTRTRELHQWRVDAFRPFPQASDLAAALEDVAPALAAKVKDESSVTAATLEASFFRSAFPRENGAKDVLPPLGEALAIKLLTETEFKSARGAVWKERGALKAWAPTASEPFSIVPRNNRAGFFEVSEASCERCHRDAGRPFKDWYPEVLAYGELWGEDENFTWHPFDASKFVDANGDVRNFNYDNRAIRSDFVNAGLVAKFDPAKHPAATYTEIPRAWRNFKY